LSAREGEACRSSGERFESETLQIDRRPNIPRVWNDETS
jgi:hypothetical protein